MSDEKPKKPGPKGPKKFQLSVQQKAELIEELKKGTKSMTALAREYGFSRQGLYSFAQRQLGRVPRAKGPAAPLLPAVLKGGLVRADAPPPEDEIAALATSSNRDWLLAVRDNSGAPWAERTKCALALARLDREEQATKWTPPEGVAWAEALAAALAEQPVEVRENVLAILNQPSEPASGSQSPEQREASSAPRGTDSPNSGGA